MLKSLIQIIIMLIISIPAFSDQIESQKVSIRVINYWGETVPNTFVLVGTASDVPFKNNWSKTSAQGLVEFDLPLVQNQPITLVAAGHPRITYLNQSGNNFIFKLPPPTPAKKVEIAGNFTNWLAPSNKGMAIFGLFIPFVEVSQLFTLQMSDLMSTTPDYFSVFGQKVGVPSNLVLPKQSLSYGFIPITVDKGNFRLPIPSPSLMSFSAIAGEMPFKEVADIMRDKTKSPFDAVNLMAMRQFGTIKNREVREGISNTQMNLNEGKLAPCIEVTSENNPEGLNVVSVALVRDQGASNAFQVTDLKKVDRKSVKARCIENDPRKVTLMSMGVGYHKEDGVTVVNKGMSGIIARNIQRDNFIAEINMNSYFKVPSLKVENNGKTVLVTERPETKVSPVAEALYAVYSDVTKTPFGDFIIEDVKPKWVVFGYGDTQNIQLPELPPTMSDVDYRSFFEQIEGKGRVVEAQRWETVWLGLDPKYQFDPQYMVSTDLGYNLFETMTHTARNSADF